MPFIYRMLIIIGVILLFCFLGKIGGELGSIWRALDRRNDLAEELIDEIRKTREAFCAQPKSDKSDDNDETEKTKTGRLII